jgi:hypothetical protein
MTERRWSFVVQDARARKHRGIVTWGADTKVAEVAPDAPREFHIGVLTTPSDVRAVPEGVAICVPGVPRLRAIRPGEDVRLPRRIADLTLPSHKMAEYAAGRIVMLTNSAIAADDVFPAHSDHPRLDRLALALIEAAAIEATAPYIAVIRHELGLSPGADALGALGERLAPANAAQRPPARAPGIVRLARALRRLRDGLAPADSLEQITDDLRFLRLFAPDEPVLASDALERLLHDVTETQTSDERERGKIVPLRPKRGSE